MRQIATDKKHGRAIVALDQFLTDHCDYSHALTLTLALTLTFAPALALPTLSLTLLHPSGEAPDDAAQNLTTLDLTDDRSAGAMKGTKTKGTTPRGSTATKAGTTATRTARTTTTTTTATTTAADGAAVVSEPPLEPPRPRGFGQAARKPKGGGGRGKGPKRR